MFFPFSISIFVLFFQAACRKKEIFEFICITQFKFQENHTRKKGLLVIMPFHPLIIRIGGLVGGILQFLAIQCLKNNIKWMTDFVGNYTKNIVLFNDNESCCFWWSILSPIDFTSNIRFFSDSPNSRKRFSLFFLQITARYQIIM